MDSINYILDELYSKVRNGIKPGLERTIKLADKLDNPQNTFKSIHIAGTNGKGSVSSILASILIESGYRVGLYTSPHILKFNERIQINGKYIDDKDIIDIYKSISPIANDIEATFFEITTLIAFEYFKRNNIDIAVIETGMGGRYDSTNIIQPLVSIITSISIDHQQYLGNFIDEIAFQKAGIIKQNIPIVIQNNTEEVLKVITEVADQKSAPIYSSKNYNINNIEYLSDITMMFQIIWNNELIKINTPLAGSHQIENHKTIFTALKIIERELKNISKQSIINGIRKAKINTNLSGRLDLISLHPKVIIDGSHNPDAIFHCLNTLELCNIDLNDFKFYFACMIDKNYSEMLNIIRKYTDNINIVKINENRAATPNILSQKALQLNYNVINEIDIEQLFTIFSQKKQNMLIFGSFYLISEFLEKFKK